MMRLIPELELVTSPLLPCSRVIEPLQNMRNVSKQFRNRSFHISWEPTATEIDFYH
jgi:hypothetical protein